MTDSKNWPSFSGRKAAEVEAEAEDRNIGFILEGRSFKCRNVEPAILWHYISEDNWPYWQIIEFVRDCIMATEDKEIFDGLVASTEIIIPIETLLEVVAHLVMEYAGRPIKPPSILSSGPSPAGTGSTGGVSSPGSTSKPSLSTVPSTS